MIDIFVLCHDRPKQAEEAISSILSQNASGYRLIVSDNSTGDEMENMVMSRFPAIDYRRRPKDMPAIAHFNTCIGETSADYFCLFHDDDRMHENFVAEITRAIAQHPEAIAFGANACVEDAGRKTRVPSFSCLGPYELVATPRALFRRYFGRHHAGIAPFPGYVYKTSRVSEMRIPREGGKYADVSWLLMVAARGPIVWIAATLFDYRIHGGNDGLRESRLDRLSFLSFLKRNRSLCGQTSLADYRFFLYKKISGSLPAGRFPRRETLFRNYLRRHRIARLFRTDDVFDMLKTVFLKKFLAPKTCR